MKVIILIVLVSYLIYKTGAARKWLNHFRLSELEYIEEMDPPEIENLVNLDEMQREREQLEIQAAYIIKQQGHNPYTVKYMGDDLLRALIKDYIKTANED